MSYRVAAIDIHKKVLMVVVATAASEVRDSAGEALEFECRRFGAGNSERLQLGSWLRERGVTEVVMESTAQYWKPVWLDLEPHFAKLHLAQAHSNRAPKGRKNDFRRRQAAGPTLARGGVDLELRAGPRTTNLANPDTEQTPTNSRPRAVAEPTGSLVGGDAD